MNSRTIKQNFSSGVIAGTIAWAIYSAIAVFFYGGLTGSILSTGMVYGIATLAITFLLSFAISSWKSKR